MTDQRAEGLTCPLCNVACVPSTHTPFTPQATGTLTPKTFVPKWQCPKCHLLFEDRPADKLRVTEPPAGTAQSSATVEAAIAALVNETGAALWEHWYPKLDALIAAVRADQHAPPTPPIEIRPDDLGIDEVVASHADVHLERMSTTSFALVVATQTERICITLHTESALISALESWRENSKEGNDGSDHRQ